MVLGWAFRPSLEMKSATSRVGPARAAGRVCLYAAGGSGTGNLPTLRTIEKFDSAKRRALSAF